MANVIHKCCNRLPWILLLVFFNRAVAQDTTALPGQAQDSTKIIHLLNADVLLGIQPGGKDSSQMQKLIGHVRLQQGGTVFTCDSALQNLTLNTIDAFGHIHINQADTINTYSDFLHYAGNTKIATLRKNVRMTDGHMVLTTNLLNYDMNTHIGNYMNGGKLVNKSTVLTSRRGYYYADTKDVYFKTDVQLVDPEYTLATDTLLYNTISRIATFEAPTTINTGRSVIHTSCGYYSTVENYAHLCNRSTIIDSTQRLTADSMNYNKNTGIGKAYGNVVWTDTAQKMNLLSNYAVSNQLKKTILATQKPLLIIERNNDTLFMAADTLFSGPLNRPKDKGPHPGDIQPPIRQAAPGHIKTGKDTAAIATTEPLIPPLPDTTKKETDTESPPAGPIVPSRDTAAGKADTLAAGQVVNPSDSTGRTPADTLIIPPVPQITAFPDTVPVTTDTSVTGAMKKIAVPAGGMEKAAKTGEKQGDTAQLRYVIAYHHVRLFSDSLQGVSDSLYYSDVDSAFHFYKDPVLWTGNTQLTGDTIVLLTRNQQADKILLQQHAMIINKIGPGTYNQIQGRNITGYFKEGNQLSWMNVNGNAQSLYYAQDNQGALVGGNHTTSAKINLYFKDGKLDKVVFLKDVDGTFIPPTKIPEEDKKLKGFRWEETRRPKSKAELMQ